MTPNFGEMLKKLGSLLDDKEDINKRKHNYLLLVWTNMRHYGLK